MTTLPERITTQDVATRLGIPLTKLKFWIRETEVEIPKDGSGAYRWDEASIALLERVKVLREIDDRTMETVRRIIGTEAPAASVQRAPGEGQESAPLAPSEQPDSAGRAPIDFSPVVRALEALAADMPAPPDEGAIARAVVQHLGGQLAETNRMQADLAETLRQLAVVNENYAHARHALGRLESENRNLTQQLGEARALLQAAPPPPPTFWERLFGKR